MLRRLVTFVRQALSRCRTWIGTARGSESALGNKATTHAMYLLRFPFQLTAERAISDLPQELVLGPYHARLETGDNGYVLTVSGFPDEDSARACDGRIRLALTWLLLEYNLAAKPVPSLRDVHYCDDPAGIARRWKESYGIDFGERIDGVIDGNCPAIYRTDENIRKITAGPVTATLSRKGPDVIGKLFESIERFPAATIDDVATAEPEGRLETALDLYGAHTAEQSTRARFLTLIMAMEALCAPQERPAEVQVLLKEFANRINDMKGAESTDADICAVLESLQRELDFRSGDSIRNQIRRLIRTTLASEIDVEDVVKEMLALYDKRSTLLHTGTLPRNRLNQALPRLRHIAQRVLRAKLDAALGGPS